MALNCLLMGLLRDRLLTADFCLYLYGLNTFYQLCFITLIIMNYPPLQKKKTKVNGQNTQKSNIYISAFQKKYESHKCKPHM
jgi:hypothetical protein